jgi:biotin carboxyl carrier protein
VERIERIGAGTYAVEIDGRRELVYVAGPSSNAWVFWNGNVYRGDFSEASKRERRGRRSAGQTRQVLTAPMPATVIKLLVSAGQKVQKSDTVVVLEAMKMELPIRALADATVAAIHVREGELVQADATLIEFEE